MAKTKQITIVTTSRADFSIYVSILKRLSAIDGIISSLIVSGSHLSPEFGRSVSEIEASGLAPISARIECLLSSDSPQGVSKAMGMAQISFAQEFERAQPDLLILLGDRFEMHAAACAAVPFKIPIAHIHGGEETEGAIDNAFRHSITKLSHLHFVSTQLAGDRVRLMGENPNNIHQVGAPALDNILETELISRQQLDSQFGIPQSSFSLVTYHPETLNDASPIESFEEVWNALKERKENIVLTGTNSDTHGRLIRSRIFEIVKSNDNAYFVEHFGAQGYYSAMSHADLMIGNSSSGIIEAASFGLPVVNIGDRQKGRERSPNTIDVKAETKLISAAISKATSPSHREICSKKNNVYGDGNAAAQIATLCEQFLQNQPDVRKSFHI